MSLSDTMDITTATPRIERLIGEENWSTWSFLMKLHLIRLDLWSYVDLSAKSDDPTKGLKAFAEIAGYLGPTQLSLVRQATCGREAWKILAHAYEAPSPASRLVERQELLSLRMTPDESITSWATRVQNQIERCRNVGSTISAEEHVTQLLAGLTDAYTNEKRALYTQCAHAGTEISVQHAIDTLKSAESMERASQRSINTSAFRATPGTAPTSHRSKRNDQCNWCKKMGHWESECLSKKAGRPRVEADAPPRKSRKRYGQGDHRQTGASRPAVTLTAITGRKPGQPLPAVTTTALHSATHVMTYIDSGANKHIFSDRAAFSEMEPTNIDVHIASTTATSKATGKGTVSINVDTGSDLMTLNLTEALFVPNAGVNLVSLGALIEKGAQMSSGKDGTLNFTFEGQPILQAKMCGRLWPISLTTEMQSNISTDVPTAYYGRSEPATWDLWHERLGHASIASIKRAAASTTGINIKTDDTEPVGVICAGCEMGSGHRRPFPSSTTPSAETPFELMHADLFGPMQHETPQGGRFASVFLDDYSKALLVFIVAAKSDALETIKAVNQLATQLGHSLRRLRTDNDGSYCSSAAESYYKDHGVSHETTVPYTPQQNGAAERSVRTVSETANNLMQQAVAYMGRITMDSTLWGEAVKTAAYVLNRVPRANNDKTPYELLTGKKPDVSHLRVFGSTAYIHIPKQRRESKFSPHRKLVTFVGYPEGTKAWRFFDHDTRKFINARDASFLEIARMESSTLQSAADPAAAKPAETAAESAAETAEEQLESNTANPAPEAAEDSTEDTTTEPADNAEQSLTRQTPQPTRQQPTRSQRPRKEWDLAFAHPATAYRIHATHEIPQTYQKAMKSPDAEHWAEACASEIASLTDNGTYELVDLPPNRTAIGTKWVFDVKIAPDGSIERYKARQVAKGFRQIAGVDYLDVTSPVASYTSIRIFLAMAASEDAEIVQADVVTAFLNAPLQEEIYVQQPEGFAHGSKVWKLRKALYGLKQAGREWYNLLADTFRTLGFRQLASEPCLYVHDELHVRAITVVDDILLSGPTPQVIETILTGLEQHFKLKRLGNVRTFVGLQISRNRERRTISIGQEPYARDILLRYNYSSRPLRQPFPVGYRFDPDAPQFDRATYQSAVGSLMFLMVATRPDLAFAMSTVSRHMSNPNESHWKAIEHILRYVAGTSAATLTLGGSGTLVGFADASFADDASTGRSTSGYIFLFGNGAISWSSKRQHCVALSTTEAEYMGAAHATKEAVWLLNLLDELGCCTSTHNNSIRPLRLYGDNSGALALSASPVFRSRTKHINVRYHYIREAILRGDIDYAQVSTNEMIADALTKPVAADALNQFKRTIGLTDTKFNLVDSDRPRHS